MKAAGTAAERTEVALRFLRTARSSHLRQQRKNSALLVYGVALAGVAWGLPALSVVAEAGRGGGQGAEYVSALRESAGVWIPALLALTLLLSVRGARWRGPVVVDLPVVGWLLPQPLLRARILTPRFRAATLVAGATGAVAGAVLGFALYAAGAGSDGRWAVLAVAGAFSGLITALLCAAGGVLAERHEEVMARRGRLARLGVGALGAASAASAVSAASVAWSAPSWLSTAAMWSGPWGWAAQPLVAAVTGRAHGWPAAALASVCCAVVVLVLGFRAAPRIRAESLRTRARAAARLGASLFSLDPRQAYTTVRAFDRRAARPLIRLPVPRRSWLLVPWRDATGLLRAPGRLGWAALWCGLAHLLAAVAHAAVGGGRVVAACAAVGCGYLAAAQLAEPARLECDDPRRRALLPYSAPSLALRHALVPGAVLTAASGAACAVCALAGWRTPGAAVLLTSVPALTGVALVSAYRGPVPVYLLIGTETPMGSTAPLQVGLWYLRGPLALLVPTVPVLVHAAGGGGYGLPQAAWLSAAGAAALWWARRAGARAW